MAQSKLDIIITAQDKTGAQLAQLSKDLGSLNSRLGENQAAAKSAGTSAKSMFTSFTAAGLAVQGITAGLQGMAQGIRNSIQESNRLNNSLIGLNTIATAFGADAKSAENAAKSLASDGLMTVADAATGLKNLLQTGFSLDEATRLMMAFKDSAAFGRQGALDFGEAIAGATEGVRQGNSVLVDNSGVTKNLSVILEEAGYSAQDMGKASSDAGVRQAIFNGILRETAPMLGDAARLSNSYAGEQARASAESRTLSATIGDSLQPALSILNQGLVNLLRQGTASASDGMQNLQGSFVALASVARAAGDIIFGAVKLIIGAIASALTLSWDPLEDAWSSTTDSLVNTAIDMQKGFERIAAGTADTQISEQVRAADGMVGANKKAAKKMADDIAEANRQFARSQEDRLRQFKESLRDMVIAHRDKSQDIKRDLASEDAAYAQSAKRREADYTKDIENLEERHKDKIADITDQITKEKNSGLEVDGVLYRQANQQKLDELQEQLQKENENYQKSLADRKAQYDQEAADDKARHEERRNQLQTDLDAELAILQKHSEDVKAVGDAQKEDDITRLKRQFAEANALAEQDHKANLVKIRQRGTESGQTFGGAFANASKPGTNQVKTDIQKMFDDIQPIASSRGKKAGDSWWSSFVDGAVNLFNNITVAPGSQTRSWLDSFTDAIIGRNAEGTSNWRGGLTWVGEKGPELVNLPQGSQVIPHQESMRVAAGNSGQSVTIGSVNLYNQTDTTAFLREIAFELN